MLAFLTFFAGLTRIGPTTASTLSTFEPIVAVALATIVPGETITPVQVPGGVFILVAVVILSRNELRREKRAREQAAADGSGGAGDESVEERDESLVAATPDS